jgi:hypothetical protein
LVVKSFELGELATSIEQGDDGLGVAFCECVLRVVCHRTVALRRTRTLAVHT